MKKYFFFISMLFITTSCGTQEIPQTEYENITEETTIFENTNTREKTIDTIQTEQNKENEVINNEVTGTGEEEAIGEVYDSKGNPIQLNPLSEKEKRELFPEMYQ